MDVLKERSTIAGDIKWVLLTVTGDSLGEELLSVLVGAKRWNFLDKKEIEAIGLVSAAQLEFFVQNKTPDELGKLIDSIWAGIDPFGMEHEVRAYWVDQEIRNKPIPDHLKEFSKRLLPGMNIL
jgi:hypothetical protein